MMKYEDLPKDEVLERQILSLILFMPDRLEDIIDLLNEEDFTAPSHQQIYQAMKVLFIEGKPVEFQTIRLELKNHEGSTKQSETVLAELLQEDISGFSILDFVHQLKNKSLLRSIIKMSQSHIYSSQIETAKAQDVLQDIEKDLLTVLDKSGEAVPSDAKSIVDEVQEDIAQGMRNGWKGFDTGFKELDEAVGGFIPSQVWVIGAYTGVGKTFLILQMLLSVLRQNGSVILFSTEMDRRLNMLRLIGHIAEIGTIQMMRNQLDDEQAGRMEKAKKELRGYGDRLFIYDNIHTVEGIRLKTKKLVLSKGVNVVAVDYIQNLKGEGLSIYEKMSTAATDLYRMAQELKPTLLIGSQISQAAVNSGNKQSIEFKGAGEIAAVADVALWMEKRGDRGERRIILRKVRHGKPAQIKDLKIVFPSGRFIKDDPSNPEPSVESVEDQI